MIPIDFPDTQKHFRNTFRGPPTLRTRAVLPPLRFFELATVTTGLTIVEGVGHRVSIPCCRLKRTSRPSLPGVNGLCQG